MDKKIKVLEKLEEKHFIQMEKIELKYYSKEHITPWKETKKWYDKYNNSTVAIEHEGKIIAFLNMFPIKKDIYDKIKQGIYNDKFMTAGDMASVSKKMFMYLSCIVVEEGFRIPDVFKLLFDTACSHYDGCDILSIIEESVTKEGASYVKKLNFKPVCETIFGTYVFECLYSDFMKALNSLK
ncbi:MAG: hypothetical protein VB120_07785 [Lachnospiraceae bacterium]|nr:hypothetical protein [Lachnospiraceae bacterium]